MALNRTSDSLSRCDPNLYSSLYDVRKRPDIKLQVSATQPTHKDTIDISKDKIKEEALSRLRHTSSFVIAQNSFMRIGKYLFLAVALPPYLLVYGLPKWILVEAIPALFSMFVLMWKKVQGKTQQHMAYGARKVGQMLQFLQNLRQALLQPVVHLASKFQQTFQHLFDRGAHFFKQLQAKMERAYKIPLSKLSKGWKNVKSNLMQAKEKVSQKMLLLTQTLEEKIQQLKQSPQAILGHLQQFKESIIAKGFPLVQRFRTSQQIAEKAQNWVSSHCKQVSIAFKRTLEPLRTFYREHVQAHFKKWSHGCSKKWEQMGHFFQQKHRKALHFLNAKKEKFKELSGQAFIQNLLARNLPSYLRKWLHQILSYPLVRSLIDKVVSIYAGVNSTLLTCTSACLEGVAKVSSFLSKNRDQVRDYARMTLQLLLTPLRIGLSSIRKIALLALYYTILYLMMAAFLLIWGISSLGSVTNTLMAKVIRMLTPNRAQINP